MLRLSPNFSRNVDWNLLKTFHEIAEAGGVSRAGRVLRRKQPALSLALKRLEAELGVTLCRRGPRGFELTDEGMLVAETCRSLNSLVRNVPKRLGNLTEEVRGRISIQVISSLVCERFDAAISRLHDRHPKVEILIDITTWDPVAAALRDEIDIGVASAQTQRSDLTYDFRSMRCTAPIAEMHPLYGKTSTVLPRSRALLCSPAPTSPTSSPPIARVWSRPEVAGFSEHLDEAKRLTVLGVGICFSEASPRPTSRLAGCGRCSGMRISPACPCS
jgi:DNA-binding transcriptional LysR family regulator